MSSPKVSVVMSVYNGAKELASSIASVQKQTFKDFEFVIVNDGSTDNSLEILREIERSDDRIRILDQENTGLTRALIAGCNASKAEFIARQDVGDYSHPSRFEEQVAFLEQHPEVGFVSSFSDVYGPSNEYLMTIKRSSDIEEATINIEQKKEGPPGHGSVMFRKSVYEQVGGYRSQFYFGQDSDLWLRMYQVSKLGYVPKSLYAYKIEETGISTSQRDIQKEFGRIAQKTKHARLNGESQEEFLLEAQQLTNKVLEARKAKKANDEKSSLDMNYFIGSLLVKQKDGHARKYLWKVLREKPFHSKALALLAKAAFLKEKPPIQF